MRAAKPASRQGVVDATPTPESVFSFFMCFPSYSCRQCLRCECAVAMDTQHCIGILSLKIASWTCLRLPSSHPCLAAKYCAFFSSPVDDADWTSVRLCGAWCAAPGCGTREDTVACLTCGYCGCGRETDGQHALQHHRQTGHTLTMALASGAVFCYMCNEWVIHDNAFGGIQVINGWVLVWLYGCGGACGCVHGCVRMVVSICVRVCCLVDRVVSFLSHRMPAPTGHERLPGRDSKQRLQYDVHASWHKVSLQRRGTPPCTIMHRCCVVPRETCHMGLTRVLAAPSAHDGAPRLFVLMYPVLPCAEAARR